MRIRIQQLKLMRIHADPDTDPDPKPWFHVFPIPESTSISFNCTRYLLGGFYMRIHNAKLYSSSQCSKLFTRKKYLKIHGRIHTGDKP
jgi:hypothetical protein